MLERLYSHSMYIPEPPLVFFATVPGVIQRSCLPSVCAVACAMLAVKEGSRPSSLRVSDVSVLLKPGDVVLVSGNQSNVNAFLTS